MINTLNPINLNNGILEIHPLRNQDIKKGNLLERDIFEILGNEENTEYIPEKRVTSLQQVVNQTMGVVISYSQKLAYMHFLTMKALGKTIGVVNILSPLNAQETYNLQNVWLIEYFLNKTYWGNGIMTEVVGEVIDNMRQQGIKQIGAFVYQENFASTRLLEKVGFKKIDLTVRGLHPKKSPKFTQVYYEISFP
jgi:RimJ/RimL family protein N-acetyltransferase